MVNVKLHTELNSKHKVRKRSGRSSRKRADCINVLKKAECEIVRVDSHDRLWGSVALSCEHANRLKFLSSQVW